VECQFFVTGGDAAVVFDSGEEGFDAVSMGIGVLVKGGFDRPIGFHGYGGGAALFLHTVADGIAVTRPLSIMA